MDFAGTGVLSPLTLIYCTQETSCPNKGSSVHATAADEGRPMVPGIALSRSEKTKYVYRPGLDDS